MKTKIIFQVSLFYLICGAHRSPAACRTTTVNNATVETKIIIPFALPVGIPVAPLAPYFYSYRETQPQDQAIKIESQAQPPAASKPDTSSSSLAPQASLVAQHCATCHGGSSPKAGLSFESLDTVSLADRLRAVRAVASGRMPKGETLSADAIRALIAELTQINHGDTEAQR